MKIIFLIIVIITTLNQVLNAPNKHYSKGWMDDLVDGFLGIKQATYQLESFLSQVKDVGTCTGCITGVGVIKSMVYADSTPEDIAKLISEACLTMNLGSKEVCSGIGSLFSTEFEYILKTNISSYDLCSLYFGDETCSISLLSSATVSKEWKISFPTSEKPKLTTWKNDNENVPTLKILQISDIHYDPYYKVGSNAVCNEPLCCRNTSGPVSTIENFAGQWGDYRNCDIPKTTFENMLSHIKLEHSDLDYIIWTGDIPPHDIWMQTAEGNLDIIKETANLLKDNFPDIPVFPCLGNHEIAPVDNFPPSDFPEQKFLIYWFYDELVEIWSTWLLNKTVEETIKWGGFYSHLIKPGFRIISLNMNFCNNLNWWLVFNSTDPSRELQWLIVELQLAENNGEKVHIIGHIPPGSENCIKYWSENFHSIVNRYENTIVAQFYGHTHFDEFEIFYDESNTSRAINVAYIGPSVTTFVNLNPGYRIYYIDGDHLDTTRAVLDYETWTMDLKMANLHGQPLWYKLYSAKENFQINSLHPEDWNEYLQRLMNNPKEFDTFYNFYYRDSQNKPNCDLHCKNAILCNLKSARSYDEKRLCNHLFFR